ncbi:zinc finger protein 511 [Tiliqua scincoides]|uniref:zinc finger protein 511 n=1 Tax=Tiliqua scincoides TaxID=71010 RepID=UPI0034617EF8
MAPPFRFRPARLRFPAQHRFFEEGDVQRHLQLRALREPDQEQEPPRAPGSAPPDAVRCQAPGCAQTFASLRGYEQHYQARHRAACAACGRALPSAHLLALHLQERHPDALFALAARRAPAYQCLLESCPERFRSCGERRAHLVGAHRYPPDFCLDRPSRDPRSCTEPRRSPPREGAVQVDVPTEASEQGPGEAMETSSAERPTEDPGQPVTGAVPTSGPRWLYRARIPSSICFGQGAPRGFGGRNEDT